MAQKKDTDERRAEWNFVITEEGWMWEVIRPDGSEERSTAVYDSLKKAGDDAIAHGFGGSWKDDERRQLDR
jgi:hypothetical protein